MVSVPRFAELSAKKLYRVAIENPRMSLYLPDPLESSYAEDTIGISREFLYNIINTCDDNFFQRNIPEAFRMRREAEMAKR